MINTYDIDGVIYLGQYDGLYPGKYDVIITGRSIEEEYETLKMLGLRNIRNKIYFNPLPFNQKTRVTSGQHKGRVIKELIESGIKHGVHFEDDDIQIEEIRKIVPTVRIVHVVSDLVNKENVRHP
jgi:predicted phosphatase